IIVSTTLTSLLMVTGVALSLEVGEKAPDFTLPSTTGEQISLSQFRGKQHVLLEFYVRDHGPTGMKNLSARQVDYSAFQELGVQVLGIAAEHSFSQRPFADSLHLSYPLLSDYPALKVIQRYTGLQPHPSEPHRRAARRTLVLIDIQGIIR